MRRKTLIGFLALVVIFAFAGSFSVVLADGGVADCQDGEDNDGDGLTDFSGGDPGCSNVDDNREVSGANVCDNGLDDDEDGFVDFGGGDNSPTEPDPGCASPTDTDETDGGTTECSDGLDNDNDDATDLFDDDCTGPEDFHEGGTDQPQCNDGIDNDGDGLIDGDDPDGAEDPDDDDIPEDNDGTDDVDEPDPATLDPDCVDEADDDESGHVDHACPEVREACNVTGTKFHDTEPLGERNEGDGVIPGVEIHLFNEDLSVHLHTTSASDGFYGFLVEDGTYTLCETVPPEAPTQTFPTEGADCSTHEVGEGQTIGPIGYAITIDAEHPRADNLDFGNGGGGGGVCPEDPTQCNVTGVKWDDVNGDGVLDEGELGLAGVEIVLFDSEGAELSSTVSLAPDGFYGFKVEPGSYTLCEVLPEGATQTAPAEGADCAALDPDATRGLAPLGYEVTIVADEISTGNDFGNVSAVHCSGTANGGHTDGLLLPDTIGQTLWDGGLQIGPLTEDPEHNGILSQPLADLELGLLGTEEIGCAVDLVLDESTGLDP